MTSYCRRALIVPAGHGDYLGSTDSGPVDRALTESCLTLIRRFLDYEPG